MNCPICSTRSMKVVDTRAEYDGNFTRRRLECRGCLHRFTSYEVRDELLVNNSKAEFYMTVNRIKEENRLRDPKLRHLPPRYALAGVKYRKFSINKFIRDLCHC